MDFFTTVIYTSTSTFIYHSKPYHKRKLNVLFAPNMGNIGKAKDTAPVSKPKCKFIRCYQHLACPQSPPTLE